MDRPRPPYEYERPIVDPRLLELRGLEIEMALDSVAPEGVGQIDHALLIGERRSGRTSTLQEVARRASEERGRVAVRLRPTGAQFATDGAFLRHLLMASVEAVAARYGDPKPDWYVAWRERVYLGSRGRVTPRDVLGSALVFAAQPAGEIDPVVVEQDLTSLRELAQARGAQGIVLTLDDAGDLTADIALLEHVLACLDAARGWSLLLAGLPASYRHFREAASPCLRRFYPVYLAPFRAQQVMTCLTVPAEGRDVNAWVKVSDSSLARDLVQLTDGNPFEIMLVAHHMWLACEIGQNDHFALTPRVLDRVVHELAVHTSGGEALLDAARAIRRLDNEQMPTAIELVASSRLTVREIATARALGVAKGTAGPVLRDVTAEDIDRLTEEVRHELVELEDAGVVELVADGARFKVQGGRPVAVLLKYEAQAGRCADSPDRPFGRSFLATVGLPLMRDVFSRTAEKLTGTRRLGSGAIETGSTVRRSSPRQAVAALAQTGSLDAVARGDLSLLTWTKQDFERVSELIGKSDCPTIALLSASLSNESELEYVELWELPARTDQHVLTQTLAGEFEEVIGTLDAAELGWRGAEDVVLSGDQAREALTLFLPYAADGALADAFFEFRESRAPEALAHAITLAEKTAQTLRSHHQPLWLRAVLSGVLSKSGFLKAFDDGRLSEAEQDLRDALETGPADS
jgi:hypothetical protein